MKESWEHLARVRGNTGIHSVSQRTEPILIRHATATASFLLASALNAPAATLYVDASGVQPGTGTVFASLCVGGLEEQACTFGQTSPARAETLRFTFTEVPPGTYAVAVFQDLNGNRRLDRTPLGLPLEPYGFSNDAGRLRRPTFAGASIRITDRDLQVSVRLAVVPQGRQP